MEETQCVACPLRALPLFLPHSAAELELLQSRKRREIVLEAGAELIQEGQTEAPLYTLREGWGFRFKTLSDVKALTRMADLYGDGKPPPRPLV